MQWTDIGTHGGTGAHGRLWGGAWGGACEGKGGTEEDGKQ